MPAPVLHINNSAWQSARARAADKWEEQTGTPAPEGFRRVRVHDMKHTFGRRSRAAGVSFEDRQDLLGHRVRASRRTTRGRSLPTSSRRRRRCVRTKNSRKFPQESVYGAGWGESGMSKMLILFANVGAG